MYIACMLLFLCFYISGSSYHLRWKCFSLAGEGPFPRLAEGTLRGLNGLLYRKAPTEPPPRPHGLTCMMDASVAAVP